MANTVSDYLKFFAPYLKKWVEKQCGPKPTEAQLLTPFYWGLTRPGIEALATAMALRDCGYTVAQYLIASGAAGAAHNKQRYHRDRGMCSYAATGSVDGHPNARVFTMTPSKKGLARIEAGKAMATAIATSDTPVTKAKPAKVKPRKPRAVKVTPQVNVAPEVTPAAEVTPVAEVTTSADTAQA